MDMHRVTLPNGVALRPSPAADDARRRETVGPGYLCYEAREPARGLYDLALVGTKTLREFDRADLPAPRLYSPAEIKELRLRSRASQSVFAAYLNVSVSTVRKWEIGDKKPRGAACRLLDLIDRKGLEALERD